MKWWVWSQQKLNPCGYRFRGNGRDCSCPSCHSGRHCRPDTVSCRNRRPVCDAGEKHHHPELVLRVQCGHSRVRSEEHTSELQSRPHLVCRLLLEKKKNIRTSSIAQGAGR